MPAELFKVKLSKELLTDKWGFTMAGGKDELLVISEIEVGSIAEQIGLLAGDVIVQINNDRAETLNSKEADELLKKTENQFDLLFIRNLDHCVEDPRYEGLRPTDRKKVGFHDVLKPVLRKDWNCPWVKRDGKGLKKVIRNYYGTEPVSAPIKTSHTHFYSEPQSILAPEPSPAALEELERILQEKLAQEAEEKQRQQLERQQEQQRQQQQHRQQQLQQQQAEVQQREVVHEVDAGRVAQHVEAAQPQPAKPVQHRAEEPSPAVVEDHQADDEEDFVPGLEIVEAEKESKGIRSQDFNFECQDDSELLRQITRAIQASMEKYQGCSEGFEPSADELIDVLKNLENLAAANPAIYRAIVDQIKVHQQSQLLHEPQQPHHRHEELETPVNGHGNQYDEEIQDEEYDRRDYAVETPSVDRRENGCDELDRRQEGGLEEEESCAAGMEQFQQFKSEEQIRREEKERLIRQQVDQEHEEQLRQLKMKAKKAQEPPPPPKTITVVAGSKNRPAWPIAPGIDNGTVPRTIELTASSVEQEEEMIRSRLEVAQAAGLRHVEVIHGDETFYPQPLKDYDYPWAGSLRPVSNKMLRKEHANRRGSGDPGSTPWSGSLRHVEEKKRKSKKPIKEDDLYGDAPWMGTLRHIKPEAKVANPVKPQFKRYPDEDAPNPYSSMQGREAKPCYPLTPAAVISASGGSKEERERAKQEEEVERIRSNLRETRVVSSSLLRALMPKLLKEHESKVEALDHMESIRIMEEILGMQIGLSTAQVDDDNEEAEAMIRAIESGEDLTTDFRKKVGLKKNKKKKKPTSKASTKELEEIAATS